ncbi:MAG: hypothetical protein ABFS34_14345, partial [Gemmatimonadota bacterium]
PLPPPADPAATPLDVLVRDFPELLAPLRAAGVDPAALGVLALRDAADAAGLDAADVVRLVGERTAWRRA